MGTVAPAAGTVRTAVEARALAAVPTEAAEVEAPVGAAAALTGVVVEAPAVVVEAPAVGAAAVVGAAEVAITKGCGRGPCNTWGKSAGLPLVSGI